jgi:hypothetical protein
MLMGLDTVSPSNGEMIYNLASSAAVDFSPAYNGKTKNPNKKRILKKGNFILMPYYKIIPNVDDR